MSSSNKNKISFNELAQEEAGRGENTHDNAHSLELTSNMMNSSTNTNTTAAIPDASSSRRGRTVNTILIAPLHKKCFQITFAILAILLITIAILTSINPPSSNFTWPPPEVKASYDPSNPTEFTSTLSTEWKPLTTFTSQYIPDCTYYQRTIMETDTSIHAATLGTVESDVRFLIDSQMKVMEETNSGKKGGEDGDMERIEYTVTHLSLSQVTNGHVLLEVDSDNEEDDMYMKKELSFIRDMIGHTSVIIIDKEGKIISSSDHEGLSNAIDANQVPNQLSASQQYHSISRFTKVLPEADSTTTTTTSSSISKVKVGDTWAFDMNVEGNDSLEYYSDHIFAGTGTLLGYTQYDGVDVAVIYLEAIVENVNIMLDIDDSLDQDDVDDGLWRKRSLLEAGMNGPTTTTTTIKSGTMTSLLYWDYVHHYPRWYKGNVDLIISMPDPLSSTTGSMIDVPTHEEFEIYMKMKK